MGVPGLHGERGKGDPKRGTKGVLMVPLCLSVLGGGLQEHSPAPVAGEKEDNFLLKLVY